jgi:Tat protein secretion system quality control protein TatD with DNase activity
MVRSVDMEGQAAKLAEIKISPLLQGAIDMHYHGYPEITLGIKARLDDIEVLEMARNCGMRGIVIKSQMWPTMDRVYYLRQRVPEIECFASITLNPIVGGLSPWVVDAAARQGAKVIWLPTWSAAYKIGQGGFSKKMKEWFPSMIFEPGLSCIDSAGKVTPDVRSIIRLGKEMNLVIGIGHISPTEALAVAQEAERIGFTRLVYTHANSKHRGPTLEEAEEMIKRGAYIELCAQMVFFDFQLEKTLELITKLEADHIILSTDSFMEWLPPGPEFLRMFIGRLIISGIDENSIRIMVRDNPATLLGLPPLAPSRSA